MYWFQYIQEIEVGSKIFMYFSLAVSSWEIWEVLQHHLVLILYFSINFVSYKNPDIFSHFSIMPQDHGCDILLDFL